MIIYDGTNDACVVTLQKLNVVYEADNECLSLDN